MDMSKKEISVEARDWEDRFFRKLTDYHPVEYTPEKIRAWADIYIGRNDVGRKAVTLIMNRVRRQSIEN